MGGKDDGRTQVVDLVRGLAGKGVRVHGGKSIEDTLGVCGQTLAEEGGGGTEEAAGGGGGAEGGEHFFGACCGVGWVGGLKRMAEQWERRRFFLRTFCCLMHRLLRLWGLGWRYSGPACHVCRWVG